MSTSSVNYVCITNNPDLVPCLYTSELIEGTAVDVLKKARDMIHFGWKLTANPLYGNFKPNQQPYRTLVLSKAKNGSSDAADFESLKLLDDAMSVYDSAPVIRHPGELPENIDKDFRYLDFVLMHETFMQTDLIKAELHRTVVMPKSASSNC